MAPSATTDSKDAIPGIPEEASKAPAGVVIPPKDIRKIVETTAGFVLRNGIPFETRIREKEKNNPKFSFLSDNDAYAPFYQWRLQEIREGRGSALAAGRAGEAAPAQEPEVPKGPAPPPEFHFSARMPNISAQDLDVVRLTALFVAMNGRSFMTTLSQKESRNYQFDFLRPQHSLYQFFSRLVDQYTLLIQSASVDGEKAKRQRMHDLEENIKDKFHILGQAKQRSDYLKFQEEQKVKKEEQAEKEQLEYAQIDWHDFVVVETVLFEEADEQADLPPPTSLNDLQSASLEQKAAMSLQPHDRRIEEAFPTSEDHSLFYGQQMPQPQDAQYPQRQQQQQPQQPYPTPSPGPYNPYDQLSQPPPPQFLQPAMPPISQNAEEERAIAERTAAREAAQAAQATARSGSSSGVGAPGQPKIRSDYVPRAQQAAKRQNIQMALCPNCKQQIPYDELEHHMKVELLDPRWKEQRQKAESRQATTNLSTSDVAANLKRLASQRSDVFDGSVTAGGAGGGGVGNALVSEEEAARRKRVALGSFDGQLDGGKAKEQRESMAQGVNIQEQIQKIHQRFKGT